MRTKLFSPDCMPDSVPIVTLDVSDFVAACEKRDPNTGRNALDAIDLILQVGFEQFGEHSCQECQGAGSVIETDPFCPDGGLNCGACGGTGKRRHSPSDPRICMSNLKLVQNLAFELRAAIDYAKGGRA
jgi:hypothetical protein